jgi:hypothetical protein
MMESPIGKLGGESTPATDEAHGHRAPAPPRTRRERLGPLLLVVAVQRPVRGRMQALGLAAACAIALGFGAALKPDPSGMGTHTQLGLGPCGFLLQTGYPCITCGMTTAFTDFAHGHVIRAFLHQPAGMMLAALTLLVGVISLAAVITGRYVRVNWYRVNPVRTVWAFVILFFASWGFKILYGLATHTLPWRSA